MRVYTLFKQLSWDESSEPADRVGPSELEAHVMHGIAYRGGDYAWGQLYHPSVPDAPLRIARSGRCFPEIYSPIGGIVVSHRLRQRLEARGTIGFYPARYEKLVDLDLAWAVTPDAVAWWEAEARKQYTNPPPEYIHPFDALPDVPEFHAHAPPIHEMAPVRYERIAPPPPAIGVKRLRIEYADKGDGHTSVVLSPGMIERYPIISKGFLILGDAVFEELAPHLDDRFWIVRDYEI